jgi:methionyl aminopeptidase
MSMFKRSKRKLLRNKRTKDNQQRLAPVYKTPQEIKIMREAGRIVARVHAALAEAIAPGISTWDLDQIAFGVLNKYNAVSSFIGYRGFPAHICASINEELVHGIPNKARKLKDGDIISIDVGARYRGFIGDSAWSYAVGEISVIAKDVMSVTEASLFHGIQQAVAGNRIVDISRAVQSHVEAKGLHIVREYTGHGVGRDMHEGPQVLNYVSDDADSGLELRPGLVIAIEPMVQDGTWETETLKDKWTVINKKHGLAAHFEHTIAITNTGPEILTFPW